MGVIVTRKPDPWWAAPLTQLVTGQIDAMMDRTQEAKRVEGQRAFAGMLSQLAQQNPDLPIYRMGRCRTGSLYLPEVSPIAFMPPFSARVLCIRVLRADVTRMLDAACSGSGWHR